MTAMLDLPTVIERAQCLAETIDLTIDTVEPADNPPFGALLTQFTEGEISVKDVLLVNADLDEQTRAALIVFACSLVCVMRDVNPDLWSTLRVQGGGFEFIGISNRRLPAPTQPGYAKLAHLMGERMGIAEPANFEVMSEAEADAGNDPENHGLCAVDD